MYVQVMIVAGNITSVVVVSGDCGIMPCGGVWR